jgi:hypothetical protein
LLYKPSILFTGTRKVWRVYITIIQKCGMDRTTEEQPLTSTGTRKVWRVYITIIQKCGMDRTTEATTFDYYWH